MNNKAKAVFRYVGLAIKKNGESFAYLKDEWQHSRQITLDEKRKIGDTYDYYDPEDKCVYTYRILRFEGTVYNKDTKLIQREREKEVALA